MNWYYFAILYILGIGLTFLVFCWIEEPGEYGDTWALYVFSSVFWPVAIPVAVVIYSAYMLFTRLEKFARWIKNRGM